MKKTLDYLYTQNTLSREEATSLLKKIASGEFNTSEVASFITVFNMRSITVPELEGFRDAMLELCVSVDLSEFDPIDLCGTGGDGKDTFNISTLASFVAAGSGVKVAKHGNYGVSSISGSSNMIEFFGHTFTNDPDSLRKSLDKAGICFMHAPLFHPAMKHVAPIRKELRVKTFFNMLGPMVNPAKPNHQLVGVFSLELARLYYYVYQKTNKNFMIVHALDGYDECSLTGDCKIASIEGESLIGPTELGLGKTQPEELFGGETVAESAKIFETILRNEGTRAQSDVVIANAAMAIQCVRNRLTLVEAVLEARESLESGKALGCFERFINVN